MVDLNKLQKEIYQNKVDKGFNVTDVNKEFCLTYGEIAEAYDAWRKNFTEGGEYLAKVTGFSDNRNFCNIRTRNRKRRIK